MENRLLILLYAKIRECFLVVGSQYLIIIIAMLHLIFNKICKIY